MYPVQWGRNASAGTFLGRVTNMADMSDVTLIQDEDLLRRMGQMAPAIGNRWGNDAGAPRGASTT
ncbi:Protein of unknown function [Gryllus bimaculatus]|nr:Protein of unknown function [Gryllus bimaculatus]